MTLPTKTFNQFVSDMTNAWAGLVGIAPSFGAGDPLLAIMESVSAQLVFLQGLAQVVLNLTRAQTSTGSDLDSWMAQFNFYREPATFAEGPVILSKYTAATSPISIPAGVASTTTPIVYTGGAIVQTTGGAIAYQLIPDTTQVAYNAATNTYILPAGATSISATAQAITAGSSSNVAAGLLNQLGSTVPGIDTVLNAAPIDNGLDAQSDTSFLAAFPPYLGTLAKATEAAILQAVQNVQQGLFISLAENQSPGGTPQDGAFTVYIDNGTGAPPSSLLSDVYAAVYATRAFTVRPYVVAPTVINVTVSISLGVLSSANQATVLTNVQNAVAAYINGLSEGATLYVSSVEGAALAADINVVSVKSGTTINSVAGDLSSTPSQVLRTVAASIYASVYVSPTAPPSAF